MCGLHLAIELDPLQLSGTPTEFSVWNLKLIRRSQVPPCEWRSKLRSLTNRRDSGPDALHMNEPALFVGHYETIFASNKLWPTVSVAQSVVRPASRTGYLASACKFDHLAKQRRATTSYLGCLALPNLQQAFPFFDSTCQSRVSREGLRKSLKSNRY